MLASARPVIAPSAIAVTVTAFSLLSGATSRLYVGNLALTAHETWLAFFHEGSLALTAVFALFSCLSELREAALSFGGRLTGYHCVGKLLQNRLHRLL